MAQTAAIDAVLGTDRFPEIPADAPFAMIIDGERRQAADGGVFSCRDPYEDRAWGLVPEAAPADVDVAVSAARRAFTSWRRTPQAARSRVVAAWGELIVRHTDELGRLQVHENGKTITEMRGAAAGTGQGAIHFAGLAATLHGETVNPDLPGHQAWTLREPIGVVAAITPWNNPLGLLSWKLFPAVAAGNTVVVKPSEVTPVSTLRLVELGLEAGLPPGVVNVVTGAGAAGRALAEHPDVDKVAFTGSTATGRAIAIAAAQRFARTTLELGGKGPQIVFPDADLDRAVDGLVTGLTAGAGQACNAGSRLLLHEDVHDEVLDRLTQRLRSLVLGDPLDPATQIGPLASRPQLERVLGYFDVARAEGHRLVTGGGRAGGNADLDRGFFVEPTLYAGVDNRSRLAQEEIFGPVGAALSFRTEDEAVALANDVEYGLVAGFWTRDLERAHRFAGRLEAGVVWINTWRAFSNQMPFGGRKNSGIGRETGLKALDYYTETKSVWLGLGG